MIRRLLLLPLLLMILLSACQFGASPPSPGEQAPPATATPDGGTAPSGNGEPVGEAGRENGEAPGEGGNESTETVQTESPDAATPVPSPAPTEAPDELAEVDPSGVTILFRHPFPDERAETLAALVEQFNASNAYDISVQVEPLTTTDTLMQPLPGEALPEEVNIVAASSSGIAALANDGRAIELTPYMGSRSWGLSPEETLPAIGEGEPLLSWPLSHATLLLYYNEDLLNELGFDAPPQGWEEWREMACAAAEAGHTGSAIAYSLDPTEPGRFDALLRSYGGSIVTEQDNTLALDTAEALAVTEFLQQLYGDGCLAPVVEGSLTQVQFGTGTLLFAVDSSWQLSEYAAAVENGYGGAWGVAALPHDSPEPAQSLATTALAIVESTPEQQLAAWLFLKWLTTPEQQSRWAEESDALPAMPGSISFEATAPFSQAMDLAATGVPQVGMPGYEILQLLIDEAFAQIIEGADAEETLTDIGDEVNLLLQTAE